MVYALVSAQFATAEDTRIRSIAERQLITVYPINFSAAGGEPVLAHAALRLSSALRTRQE